MQRLSAIFETVVRSPDATVVLVEHHRPSQRPYPGAPGFVLTQCRVCDGQRSTVQLATDEPRACQVWQDAIDQGVTAC